jgi:hypothetical protein
MKWRFSVLAGGVEGSKLESINSYPSKVGNDLSVCFHHSVLEILANNTVLEILANNTVLEILANATRQEKEVNHTQTRK